MFAPQCALSVFTNLKANRASASTKGCQNTEDSL